MNYCTNCSTLSCGASEYLTVCSNTNDATCNKCTGGVNDPTECYPFPASLLEGNHPGTGSTIVTIIGSALGSTEYSGQARIGDTACEGSRWASETSVLCRIAEGTESGLTTLVTILTHKGTVTGIASYDAPETSSMSYKNTPYKMNTLITLIGQMTQTTGYSGEGRVGETGCEGSRWESETSVACKVGAGAGGSLRAAVTVSEQVGTRSEAGTYDRGGASEIGSGNAAGTGARSVTVIGAGLGAAEYSGEGRVGETGCEGSRWESETSVACKVGAGAGGSLRAAVTVSEQVGTRSEAGTYDRGGASEIGSGNAAGTGPTGAVTVESGQGLGAGRVGAGAGGSLRAAVTVSEQVGTRSEAGTYDRGGASEIGSGNAAGTGARSVTVIGAGLGAAGYSGEGRVGETGCEGSRWESETSVACKVGAGAGGSLRAAVTVSEQVGTRSEAGTSTTKGVTFDALFISDSQARNSPTTGNIMFSAPSVCQLQDHILQYSILLSHCAFSTALLKRLLGILTAQFKQSQACLNGSTKHICAIQCKLAFHRINTLHSHGFVLQSSNISKSSHSFDCHVEHRVGFGHKPHCEMFSQFDLLAHPRHHFFRACCDVSRRNYQPALSTRVQLYGSKFGILATTGKSITNFLSYDSPVLITYIRPPLDKSVRMDGLVTVTGRSYVTVDSSLATRLGYTNCEKVGTTSKFYFYDIPTLSSVQTPNVVFSETTLITVYGKNYGEAAFTDMIRIGGTACENSSWLSDSAVICKPGSAHFLPKTGLPVIVSLGESRLRQIQTVFTLTQCAEICGQPGQLGQIDLYLVSEGVWRTMRRKSRWRAGAGGKKMKT
ncbi:hypothetical protein GUITHDRAFT_164463 [Guillardia theta CCMP2712]|uniref:IPT/TIG domain-containing protein n=1 Tax=Guillardia theta (strain CCMP2712) TaxID=905079 RepID=L1IYZ0_GUITC|nr:hypothetical protein GUITHDRAFT_164463 [Guillardia theta CCMP2712]EKX41050.1 hypothetical protein GUITHDRAFT_164463 [Guillardia theta CCMP2712]|eukprot:XP_005828030.1 hypothetical protein GUITHDRAFT_164463 [Guillardia theta CCMP2712]